MKNAKFTKEFFSRISRIMEGILHPTWAMPSNPLGGQFF
jgi:hypothetical protein